MFGFGREKGAESAINQLPSADQYELQTGHSLMPEKLVSAEQAVRVDRSRYLAAAYQELL